MNYQINLIRRRGILLKERRVKYFLIYLFSLIFIVSLLLVFSFYLANSFHIQAQRRETERLREEIEGWGISQDMVAKIQGRLQKVENNLSPLKKARDEHVFWSGRLATLKRLLPPEVVIEHIYIQGKESPFQQIVLEAHLPLRGGVEKVGDLLQLFDKDEAIGEARLISLREEAERGLLSFSLSLSFLD